LPASLKPGTILKEQTNREKLEGHIALLILKIARMYQIPNFDEEACILLAEDTIERYKYEPVEVLVKCLERPPSTGEKNWRLTPDTISEWMSITLEREADRVEKELTKNKSKAIEFEVPTDISKETEKKIQDYINSLSDFKKVPSLSEDHIREYGQHKPKKVSHSAGFVQPSQEDVIERMLRIEWMRENFDPKTGKQVNNYLSFEEWKMI
jgi:hypothetical protein